MLFLQQKRDRDIPCVQSPLNHLGTLRYKKPLPWFMVIVQLSLCKAGIDIQLRSFKITDFNNIWLKNRHADSSPYPLFTNTFDSIFSYITPINTNIASR